MGILADLDSVIDRQKVAAIYMGRGALHAFWAENDAPDGTVIMRNGNFCQTAYRDIPVIPTDWPHGWEIAEAA